MVLAGGGVAESCSSRAIVIRWRAYGESDKIATLLTEDYGKLTGIAKGARNSRRRFANSLEPLARVRVHFRRRPNASLAFLESCDLLAADAELIEPAKLAYGSYFAEIADQLTVEEHPAAELYALLEEALATLQRGPVTGAFLRGFELQLLARSGYDPPLNRCNVCQRPFNRDDRPYLHLTQGTFTCAGCQTSGQPTVEVASGLLPRLAELRELPMAECQTQSLGQIAVEAANLTSRLLALHLVRPPPFPEAHRSAHDSCRLSEPDGQVVS
jgi:DNA repair protein RecO (recombination protein O)